MKIDKVHILKHIKGEQKAFNINSAFWLKNEVYVKHFGANSITINRDDIKRDFESENIERGIIRTLAWGYPNAMRRFRPTMQNITLIAQLLKHKNELNLAELYFAFGALMQIEGIGPSTVTKLLFFNGNTFKHTPCLIFDENVIKSIQVFDDFELLRKGLNPYKVVIYINYLERMQEIATSFNISPEELEVYLFDQNGKSI